MPISLDSCGHLVTAPGCSRAHVTKVYFRAAGYQPNVIECSRSRPLVAACNAVSRPASKSSKPSGTSDGEKVKEAHKIFDEVFISVKSGNGGNGEVVDWNTGRTVQNFKYKPGGNQAKTMWLPASDPADGADGADVVLVCDPEVDNLLHLHKQKDYAGRNGGNANPAVGSGGPKKNKKIKKAQTAALTISVPPGTVVKRKSTGALLGELLNPGDTLLVAKGGAGGVGVKAPSRESNIKELQRQYKLAEETGAEVVAVEDSNWRAETKGQPGQQLSLHLLLRVVADIGIVGFPNAGKSSLLAALTRASPEVAPYPFTTLMPNLGVLAAPAAEGASEDFGPRAVRKAKAPVLADLPGLIEGAHKGRGLGRMFLRHLRRTSALLHVVDASAADPATDYYAVREELRMYNPEYCARPFVVALNKMDMEDAGGLRQELIDALTEASERHCQEWQAEEVQPVMPVALVPCSALTGEGLPELQRAMQKALDPKGKSYTFPAASSSATQSTRSSAASTVEGTVPVDLSAEEQRLLRMSEEALLQLAEEEERRAAAAAASSSSSSSSPEGAEDWSEDGWASMPVVAGQRRARTARVGEDSSASSSSSLYGQGAKAEVGLDEGEAELLSEADKEWLSGLSEEELLRLEAELLAEEAEELAQAQGQQEEGLAAGEAADAEEEEGEVAEEAMQVAEEDKWLLQLSDEELLAMIQD